MNRQFTILFAFSKMLNMEKKYYIILNYWVGAIKEGAGIARLTQSSVLGPHIKNSSYICTHLSRN